METQEIHVPFIIDLKAKISPATLCAIFGMNVSLVYQEVQKGRIPPLDNLNYLDAIQFYLNYFKKNAELKLFKEQAEEERKREKLEEERKIRKEREEYKRQQEEERAKARGRGLNSYSGDETMHPLMAAKLKQNIKTEYAREAQLWQKIAIERGEYVSFKDKMELIEPFVMSIKDTLSYLANSFPEIQGKIDEAMEELEQLGKQLLEEAELDEKSFVDDMLAKDAEEVE